MIDYINGKIDSLSPTTVVIDNNGIGYSMEISLQTYAILENKQEAKVYVQTQVNQREGTSVDYGFADKEERALFQLITSVSGMGASSARMLLSSFSADEFKKAILSEDINKIKSTKGIGLKTAQRIVLELKDKIADGKAEVTNEIFSSQQVNNQAVEEATSALVNLGFSKPNINKVMQIIIKKNPNAKVEEIIKAALQML